jgi:hypothetical protein
MSEPTPPSASSPTPPGPEVPTPPSAPSYASYPQYPVGPPLSAYGTAGRDPRYEVEPSKAMAGWALGLAIVPCFFPVSTLVAIGLAIAVLVKSRDGRNHGKGMAVAALVIAPLWVVGVIVAALVGAFGELQQEGERDGSGQVTESSEISILKIRVGDCFDYPELASLDPNETAESEAFTVTGRPCADPHDFEAYHAYDLTDGDYPGEDVVTESATTKCFAQFKRFVGIPYGKSELEPYFLYPTSRSWALLDDRAVTCLVGEPGKKTSGSLEGSRR